MQKLILQRINTTDKSTLGELFDTTGKKLCWTLEDIIRDKKIDGKTAIPAGIYEMITNISNRFKREMIQLLNVPNFAGVRIHGGNTSEDTEGCILVANKKINNDFIQGTMEKPILEYVKSLLKKDKVFIEIKNIK